LVKTFEDPIHGAVWSGPPFASQNWANLTAARNEDTPAWLPTYRDSRMVRFTNQRNTLEPNKPWGPIRSVYVQYASDPMVFFSTDLLFKEPDWLVGKRGPDVSPELQWYPIVTFLQVAFDLPMATSVPPGYGHNYAPAHYIDAWIAVTDPTNWSDKDTRSLKAIFKDKIPAGF
ncbi:MAG: alpha/beta-hydrolase family protein, partial [Planctomycetaceae bacterium]